MKKYTNKLFNLQGLLSEKIEFDDENKQIIINVKSPRRFAKCPYCSKSTKRIHQTSSRLIKHSILNYRIVILKLTIRRFKCSNCKKVFTEQFPGIDRRRTTPNFRLQLLDWLQRNSFRYIGQKFDIAPSTLVRYLLEMNGDIKIDWSKIDVTKLGIDEHSFSWEKNDYYYNRLIKQKTISNFKRR